MMILNLASLRRKTRKYKSSNDLHVNPNAIIIMENMDIDLKSIHLEMYLWGINHQYIVDETGMRMKQIKFEHSNPTATPRTSINSYSSHFEIEFL